MTNPIVQEGKVLFTLSFFMRNYIFYCIFSKSFLGNFSILLYVGGSLAQPANFSEYMSKKEKSAKCSSDTEVVQNYNCRAQSAWQQVFFLKGYRAEFFRKKGKTLPQLHKPSCMKEKKEPIFKFFSSHMPSGLHHQDTSPRFHPCPNHN